MSNEGLIRSLLLSCPTGPDVALGSGGSKAERPYRAELDAVVKVERRWSSGLRGPNGLRTVVIDPL